MTAVPLDSSLPTVASVRGRSAWIGRIPAPGLAAVVAGAIAALAWVRWDRQIAVGDIGHFSRARLAAEGSSFFGYSLTGEGSGSYEVARVLELPFWLIGRLFASDAVGQGLYYTVLAAAVAAAVALMAGGFTRERWIAVLVGIAGVLNPLTLTTFPNPNTLLATGVATAFIGLLLRPARRYDGLRLAACTLPAAYLAVNPPTMVVLAATTAVGAAVVALVADRPLGVAARVGKALPWALLLHLWWIVPQGLVLGADAAELASGLTSVDAWSWAHRNNSLGRVVSLGAHWGWTDPTYFPHAASLDRPWWGWGAYVLPGLAVAAPAVAPPGMRRLAAFLVAVALFGALAAKGLHEPFAGVNRWMYDSIPGWWLFREPASKWSILVLVAYLLAATLALDRLAGVRVTVSRDGRSVRRILLAPTVALALVPIVYPWPLSTGAAMSEGRGDFPSARSSVPAEWYSVARLLNRDTHGGKVLLLPVPTFYQSSTAWGFHGVDNVPRQLLTRPLVTPQGDVYFSGGADTFAGLARAAENAILAGDEAASQRALLALGVTDVLLRLDVVPATGQAPTADPQALRAALDRATWTRERHAGEVAAVFGVGRPSPGTSYGRVATYAAVADASEFPGVDVSAAVSAQSVDTALFSGSRPLPPGSPVVQGSVVEAAGVETVIDAPTNLQPLRSGPLLYDATVVGGRQLVVRQRHSLSSVPGTQTTRRVDVRRPVALGLGEERIPLRRGEATFAATPSSMIDVEFEVSRRSISPIGAEFGDCNNTDGSELSEVDIGHERIGRGVELRANEHAACLRMELPSVSDGQVVSISVDRIRGEKARACVFDPSEDRCVSSASSDHDRSTLILGDLPAGRGLQLFVYADGSAGGTRIRYEDMAVVELDRTPIQLPEAPAAAEMAGGVVRVDGRTDTPVVTGPGPLSDCYRVDDRTMEDAGLRLHRLADGAVELVASAHAACVAWEIDELVPGAVHGLSLAATAVSGRPPRYCVWADGPDRCIHGATVNAEPGTEVVDQSRFVLPVDAVGARIYVYADGPESGQTRVVYATPQVAVDPGLRWVATGSAPGSAPEVRSRDAEPGRVALSVAASDGPFVLALADGDPDGWRLDGIPAHRILAPGTVDGYAAGWVLSAGPAVDLVAVHRLDEAVGRFHLAWLTVLVAAAAAVAAREFTLRRRRP